MNAFHLLLYSNYYLNRDKRLVRRILLSCLNILRQNKARSMTRPSATRIIAVMNQTEDVGKTTITTNLGVIMAEMGYNVLLLDMDPQADLSRQFAVPDA